MNRICETQRTRKWQTENGTVTLLPDCNVLPRYLHGGDYALGRVHGLRRGGPRKKTSLPRIKLLKPPPGGWTGGA